jgi:hypothetical protein
MTGIRKSPQNRKGQDGKYAAKALEVSNPDATRHEGEHDDPAELLPDADGHHTARARRLRQGVVQCPMQILVPEETREALRQRSEDTGASIRHIILRSLAADGFPVPRMTKRRG